jgi:hypothetical protein
MLYTKNPNSLRKNETDGVRKGYTINTDCWDIRYFLINRKKEKDLRKSETLVL